MPTTMSAAKPRQFDPYAAFKFRVMIDGETVAGLSKMLASSDSVTLERGLSLDHGFADWAGANGDRREIVVAVMSLSGRMALAYVLKGARMGAFETLPTLEPDDPQIVIQSITIQHEGLVRDLSLSERIDA